MLLCPQMDAEFQGVSSQTGRIITTKNEVSLVSDDTTAWMTALSVSSGSYFGLAIHEPLHRNWKGFRIAPNAVSPGKAGQ